MIAEALRGVFAREHVIGEGDDGVLFGGLRTASGERVSPEVALKVAAVYACVSIIASGVRAMPLHLVRDTGSGIMLPERGHRLWSVFRDQPNEEMSAGELWERMSWDAMLRGNSFAWLERDRLGRVGALWPLSAGRVEIGRDPRTRRKVYAVNAGDDRERVLFIGGTEDVLHVKGDPGPDPLLGVSVIHRLREIVGRSVAEDRHAATTMRNQGRPSGVLKVEGRLDDDQAERLVKRWNAAHGGAGKAGRTAVLEEGAEWEAVTLTASDLELVKQRVISREDIAIAFKVPGDMVLAGSEANLHYSSDSTRDVRLVKHAIAPVGQRIQDALEVNPAFPWGGDLHVRFNADALHRTDLKTRAEALQILLDARILTFNEARQVEDREPLPGLDHIKPWSEPQPPAKKNGES